MKITNRKQKRKADKLGVLHEVSIITNKITGDEVSLLVTWDQTFTPTLVFIENEKVVYEVPAIQFVEHTAKLIGDAVNRFKESIPQ
jgi:hypothetical protein